MKIKIKDFFKIIFKIIILLVSVFIMLLAASLVTSLLTYFGMDDKSTFIIGKILNAVGIITVLSLYFRHKFNLIGVLKRQLFYKNSKLKIIMLVAVFLSVIIACGLQITGFIKFQGFIWQKFYAEDIIPVMIFGILECILEAFYEELVYRFAISNIMLEKFGTAWVVILTTIIYVCMYAFDSNVSIIVLINIALINVVMLTMYLRFRNIWACIFSRAIFEYIISYVFSINRYGNAIDGLISYKLYGNAVINGGVYGIYGSLIMTLVLIMLIILLDFRTVVTNIN